VESGERIGQMPTHADSCHDLAFPPAGHQLATAGWGRVLRIWDVNTRQPVATFSR
jgi:WD40 repeat protein